MMSWTLSKSTRVAALEEIVVAATLSEIIALVGHHAAS
jgi:hypothetical protein